MDPSWKKLNRDQEFTDLSDYARPVALIVTQLLVKTPITSIQVTFSFLENSEVRAGTGKGVFANTTGGLLEIDGTINVATGSIDMGFTGEFCTD